MDWVLTDSITTESELGVGLRAYAVVLTREALLSASRIAA